jgi:hypothetical protein
MSVSEFENGINWGELLRAAEDGLPEYTGQTEWREGFDYALGIKNGLLELGMMPPADMPETVFEMLKWRRDGDFAELVYSVWEKVVVPFGFTQSILVSEMRPDYPLRTISRSEMTQNSAQCIMNLCAVLAERTGEFGIPSTFIANWLGISQQVASMILKKLEAAGYLVRLGNMFTRNGKKTPLWKLGDGVPLKK